MQHIIIKLSYYDAIELQIDNPNKACNLENLRYYFIYNNKFKTKRIKAPLLELIMIFSFNTWMFNKSTDFFCRLCNTLL